MSNTATFSKRPKAIRTEMSAIVLAKTMSSGSPRLFSDRGFSIEGKCQPIELTTPEMLS